MAKVFNLLSGNCMNSTSDSNSDRNAHSDIVIIAMRMIVIMAVLLMALLVRFIVMVVSIYAGTSIVTPTVEHKHE